jgi:hypothetical protein
MNTLVRLRGYVLDAHILQMKKIQKNRTPTLEEIRHNPNTDDLLYFSRFEVTLVPENIKDLTEIDQRLRDRNSVEHPHSQGFGFYLDNNEVSFQTVRVPRVLGELTELNSDEEFKGKFVQVVGHIQTPLNKDPFISFHIIEPAYDPLDNFDPFEDGVDRYLSEREESFTEEEKRKMKGLSTYERGYSVNEDYELIERKKSDQRSQAFKPTFDDLF